MRFLRSRTFVLIVLIIGGAALWQFVIADWLAERQWKEYEREAKGRGLRWTLAEYRPVPVPADEDAALLPVFASRETYAPLLNQVPVLSKGPKRADGAPRSIDWKSTRKYLPSPALKDNPAEPNDLLALDAAGRVLQPIVDQLTDSKATAANWNDIIWNPGIDSPFDHATTAMQCFKLLHLRANLDLALKRPAEARRAIEAQLRLARVMSRAPTLILNLVTLSGVSLARETVWRGIESGAWEDETLRAFSAEFLAWNAIADFQWSMETERAWSRRMQDSLIGDAQKTIQILSFVGPPSSKLEEWLLRLAVSRPAWHRANQLWYERAQDEMASMLDAAGGTWRPVDRQYAPENLSKSERERDLVMAARSMQGMQAFMQKAVWVHAQNQMAAIACALELARRATGAYPATLESLVPVHLPRLPIDPATGAPFRYSIQPDGTYLLYSVGFDRIDQSGKIGEGTDRDQSDPDWPWWTPPPQTGPRAR